MRFYRSFCDFLWGDAAAFIIPFLHGVVHYCVEDSISYKINMGISRNVHSIVQIPTAEVLFNELNTICPPRYFSGQFSLNPIYSFKIIISTRIQQNERIPIFNHHVNTRPQPYSEDSIVDRSKDASSGLYPRIG